MTVSVLIPVRNGEGFICEALRSILAQTYRNIEVIVINDGSTDYTAELITKYFPSVILLNQRASGQAAALNSGILHSTGEFIALLDSDDVADPKRLEIQLEYLKENPNAVFCFSDRFNLYSDGSKLTRVFPREMKTILDLLRYNFVTRSTVMIRRSCLTSGIYFDEEITGNDDWLMWLKLLCRGDAIYITKPLVNYRIHDKNISKTRPKRLVHHCWVKLRMLEKLCEEESIRDILRSRWMSAWVMYKLSTVFYGKLGEWIFSKLIRLEEEVFRIIDRANKSHTQKIFRAKDF